MGVHLGTDPASQLKLQSSEFLPFALTFVDLFFQQKCIDLPHTLHVLGGPGVTGHGMGDGGHSGASNIFLLNWKASATPHKKMELQGCCGAGAYSSFNPFIDRTSD